MPGVSGNNNNNGTLIGATVNTVTSTGRFSQADGVYVFDGVDDYVDLGTNASLDLVSEFTIDWWSKGAGDIFGARSPNKTRIFVSSSQVGMLSNIPALWTTCYKTHNIDPSANFYHYTFTIKDGVGLWYVNGAQIGSCASLGSLAFYFDYIAYTYNWAAKLNGSVSNVRVYNKQLNNTDVLNLHNATRPQIK